MTRLLTSIMFLMGLCVVCVMPMMAQDTGANYQEALRLIEEARMSGATELDLSGLSLTELPPEIGQLINLRTFYLGGNQLTTLPVEVSQLTNLKAIDLGNNQLTMLPPEIADMTSLQGLLLSNNQLVILPPEIGQLMDLHWLELSHNQLTSLPPEIGQLKTLYILYLEGNPLISLPFEMGQLLNLSEFYADSTLTFPPMEVQQQGAQAIVAYLRDYESMLLRQTIAAVAAGVGGLTLLILAFRWRQRRGLSEKKKRA